MKHKYLSKPLIWFSTAVLIVSSCTSSKDNEKKEWIDPLNETTEQRDENCMFC